MAGCGIIPSGQEGYERIIPEAGPMPEDSRGVIQRFDLIESVNEVSRIDSAAGTMRGNHWHPDQEQQLLLVAGRFISLSQPVDEPEAPIQGRLVELGDGVLVTPPRILHASIFLADSILVNLVRGTRDFGQYDSHTIQRTLIQDEEVAGYALQFGVEL